MGTRNLRPNGSPDPVPNKIHSTAQLAHAHPNKTAHHHRQSSFCHRPILHGSNVPNSCSNAPNSPSKPAPATKTTYTSKTSITYIPKIPKLHYAAIATSKTLAHPTAPTKTQPTTATTPDQTAQPPPDQTAPPPNQNNLQKKKKISPSPQPPTNHHRPPKVHIAVKHTGPKPGKKTRRGPETGKENEPTAVRP